MKDVYWTQTAIHSLQIASEFLIQTWDEEINEAFLTQLDYRINQIRIHPELGIEILDSNYRKLVIHKTISLFYVNTNEYIKLLLIWDNRSNHDTLLDTLKSIQ